MADVPWHPSLVPASARQAFQLGPVAAQSGRRAQSLCRLCSVHCADWCAQLAVQRSQCRRRGRLDGSVTCRPVPSLAARACDVSTAGGGGGWWEVSEGGGRPAPTRHRDLAKRETRCVTRHAVYCVYCVLCRCVCAVRCGRVVLSFGWTVFRRV